MQGARRGLLICLLLGSLLALPAAAQELSTQQIIEQLRAKPILRDARGVIVSPAKDVTPSIDIRVHFAYDSSELDTDALVALQALGAALSDPALQGLKFQIIGHTDAKGSDEYNQALSERRARAVLDHLAFYYDLDRGRFVSMGAGESQLYDPANPEDGINRRTEIKNVTAVE